MPRAPGHGREQIPVGQAARERPPQERQIGQDFEEEAHDVGRAAPDLPHHAVRVHPRRRRDRLALLLQPAEETPAARDERLLVEVAESGGHLPAAVEAGHLAVELLGGRARARRRHLLEEREERRVLLHPRDRVGRVLGVVVAARRQDLPPDAVRELPVGVDRHVRDAQRRQDAGDVARQRHRRDDDEHLLRREAVRVGEGQVRDAVQRDGGLAAPGAALDEDQAARRRGDEVELLAIDERGDLGEVLVGARHRPGVDAEPLLLSPRGHRRRPGRPRGDPLPALQHGPDVAGGLVPLAARVADEGALRTADPAQAPLHDRQVSPRGHETFEAAAALGLVVVVTLLVPVVDLRHRRVAPVDDGHAAALDEAALADEDVALLRLLAVSALAAVAEAEVGEIWRHRVDREGARAAAARRDGRQARHLLDERREVFGLGLADGVAELDELAVVIVLREVACARLGRGSAETSDGVTEEPLLLGDDGAALHPGRPAGSLDASHWTRV